MGKGIIPAEKMPHRRRDQRARTLQHYLFFQGGVPEVEEFIRKLHK
jgi:hypothetical protein